MEKFDRRMIGNFGESLIVWVKDILLGVAFVCGDNSLYIFFYVMEKFELD